MLHAFVERKVRIQQPAAAVTVISRRLSARIGSGPELQDFLSDALCSGNDDLGWSQTNARDVTLSLKRPIIQFSLLVSPHRGNG